MKSEMSTPLFYRATLLRHETNSRESKTRHFQFPQIPLKEIFAIDLIGKAGGITLRSKTKQQVDSLLEPGFPNPPLLAIPFLKETERHLYRYRRDRLCVPF